MSNSADHQTHPSGSEEWREELAFRLYREFHGLPDDNCARLMFATPQTHGGNPERERWLHVAAHVLSAPAVQTERVRELRAIAMMQSVMQDVKAGVLFPADAEWALNSLLTILGSPVQDGAHDVEDAHG